MKIQRLLATLTILNLVLLVFLLAQMHPVEANTASSVLRGRALEIVDDRGRVRASIQLHPADPAFEMPDGTRGYPEAVLLRLITPDGKPGVKLEASERGTGILLMGEGQGKLELLNRDGPTRVIKP